MTLDQLTAFFGWTWSSTSACSCFSTMALLVLRGPITRIHARLFGLNEQDLSKAYFQYLAQFKIATILFTITPYLALRIVA